MTELVHAALRFRNMDDAELIAHVRRSAASWFSNVQLTVLEELVRRYELNRKRTPALVRAEKEASHERQREGGHVARRKRLTETLE